MAGEPQRLAPFWSPKETGDFEGSGSGKGSLVGLRQELLDETQEDTRPRELWEQCVCSRKQIPNLALLF